MLVAHRQEIFLAEVRLGVVSRVVQVFLGVASRIAVGHKLVLNLAQPGLGELLGPENPGEVVERAVRLEQEGLPAALAEGCARLVHLAADHPGQEGFLVQDRAVHSHLAALA